MAVLHSSTYPGPPFFLFHRHLETLYPSKLRKVPPIDYTRERLELPDGDFLDLDWSKRGSKNLVFVSHGLEGSSDRHYMRGMVRRFNEAGWDAMAWNCRSCSGEMNRLLRMYHHGATEDIKAVMDHVVASTDYEQIVMVGFSMGGSMTLKYLGENEVVPEVISRAIVFSVPVHLPSSVATIHEPSNWIYRKYFLSKLGRKILLKSQQFPDQMSYEGFKEIKTLYDFDNRYTVPVFGFRDAHDFYEKASSHPYLPAITRPAMIVNAQNDPILSEKCFPVQELKNHPFVSLEAPRRGGHVGFCLPGSVYTWADHRALTWAEEGH
jgi:predicted alpha/beta-fold hydrolase